MDGLGPGAQAETATFAERLVSGCNGPWKPLLPECEACVLSGVTIETNDLRFLGVQRSQELST